MDFFADGTINVDRFALRREAAEENEDGVSGVSRFARPVR